MLNKPNKPFAALLRTRAEKPRVPVSLHCYNKRSGNRYRCKVSANLSPPITA